MKNKSTIYWVIIIIIFIVAMSVWQKSINKHNPDIISHDGLHWHPELAIYVKGEKQEIPANLGMGGVEMPVHTHDSTGVIHLEMSGLIRKDNIKLGQLFKVWGKDMRSFGTNLKMTVNGVENTEYENYLMQDKDNIELRYE